MAPEHPRPGPDESEGDTDVDAADDDAPVRGDPETGSTETDPAVEGTGLPPEGDDPMSGAAPSG